VTNVPADLLQIDTFSSNEEIDETDNGLRFYLYCFKRTLFFLGDSSEICV